MMATEARASIGRLRAAIVEIDGRSAVCTWLSARLRLFLEQRDLGLSLEVALGLVGVEPAGANQARVVRDRLICELARHFPGGKYARADAINRVADRFAVAVWPRLRDADEPPVSRPVVEQRLWAIHRTGAPWPLGRIQLAKVVQSALESEHAATAPSPYSEGEM